MVRNSVVFIAVCLLGVAGACRNTNKSGPAAEPQERFGALMTEVGRRFELIGRAATAHRWQLAAYEVHELQEVFEDDLPHAKPPDEVKGVDLHAIESTFLKTNMPELKAAVDAKNDPALGKAIARAAATCNGCHEATGHAFIEVPSSPGATVPNLDPKP